MKNIGIKLTLLLLFQHSVICFGNHIGEDEDYVKDLKYLFLINGTSDGYKKSIEAMISYFKSQESDIPQSYWENAEKEFLNTSIEDLYDMIIPIYQKNLSHNDVKAMITFYESEAGKRIAKKIPTIKSESTQAGIKWGEIIGKRIHDHIESKGYKLRLPFTP